MQSRAEAIKRENAEQAKRARRRRPPSQAALRVAEINRILTHRAGAEALPDTPEYRRMVRYAAHHLASLSRDLRRSIPGWISLRAPWLTMGETSDLLAEVATRSRRWKAGTLGWAIKLTSDERKRLRFTTIAAYDCPTEERDRKRRREARNRARASRARRGALTRAEYLAFVTTPKPWVSEGISRATWYRRHRPRET